jgi:hypothetical protein
LRSHQQAGARLQDADTDDFLLLWIADQLCSGAGQLSIAQVHGWLRGQAPLTKKTISDKLKRMRKWTTKGEVGVPVGVVESV